jgi:FkbH-like protein
MKTPTQGLLTTDPVEEWHGLRRKWPTLTDYSALVRLSHRVERLSATGALADQFVPVRLAVLSGATVDFLLPALRATLLMTGLRPSLHVTAYNQFVPALLDPDDALVSFGPQVTLVVNTVHHIQQWPELGASLERVEAIVDEVCRSLLDPCAAFHERTGSEIVVNNFHPPPNRAIMNLGVNTPGDRTNFVRRVNVALGDRAPRYVHVNDVASLAEIRGLDRWFDSRYWFLAKQPVSFDCVADYCRSVAALVGALLGCTRKCLVIDLDNTMWGGIIGDDGLSGIQIGEGSPEGEAFKAFQLYLRELKQRGVLLAVCSKNDERVARSPFTDHPEMVLRLDDFVAFIANWSPKSENIRAIAAELDLPLEAIVFVDDNPAEREEVARTLPEVGVPDLPDDPAEFSRAIDSGRYFEIASLTSEDLSRTNAYRSRRAGRVELNHATDIRAYLKSLEMTASIRPFDDVSFERIVQLTNKTNQFNLTTRRVVRAEVERMASDPRWLTRAVRLKDRFGNHGLISVFFGHIDGVDLLADAWLMSCRVLNRGVEQLLFNNVIAAARTASVTRVVGYYKPTDRNRIVRDHYQKLGFTRDGEMNGVERWTVLVAEAVHLEPCIACDDLCPTG